MASRADRKLSSAACAAGDCGTILAAAITASAASTRLNGGRPGQRRRFMVTAGVCPRSFRANKTQKTGITDRGTVDRNVAVPACLSPGWVGGTYGGRGCVWSENESAIGYVTGGGCPGNERSCARKRDGINNKAVASPPPPQQPGGGNSKEWDGGVGRGAAGRRRGRFARRVCVGKWFSRVHAPRRVLYKGRGRGRLTGYPPLTKLMCTRRIFIQIVHVTFSEFLNLHLFSSCRQKSTNYSAFTFSLCTNPQKVNKK